MRKYFLLIFTFLTLLLGSWQEVPKVKQRHLIDKCSRPRGANDDISRVMLHFCSVAPENPKDPYNLDAILKIFEDLGVSAHYIIDRNGQIYELVSEQRVAYHAGKGKLPFSPSFENSMNAHSIGIEMTAIGSEKDMMMFMSKESYNAIDKNLIGFAEAQYKSLNWLLDDLMKRYPTIQKNRQHIVGHSEYASARRTDPGELFDWGKIGLK
jgi:N-acetyl-anhydromuramyl-L-alanine amidase AmpD